MKVNVIARLDYELAYYDSADQRFNHYTTRIPIRIIEETCCHLNSSKKPSANTDVKNSKIVNNNDNNNNMKKKKKKKKKLQLLHQKFKYEHDSLTS